MRKPGSQYKTAGRTQLLLRNEIAFIPRFSFDEVYPGNFGKMGFFLGTRGAASARILRTSRARISRVQMPIAANGFIHPSGLRTHDQPPAIRKTS
ncbi:hypothetical protein ACFIOY_25635 [Bradyrhizobium sp. TZ2]